MMAEPAWASLLFADISALCIFRRLHVLVELLARPALFPRLVFGSDYPVPALGGRAIGMKPQPIAVRHGGAFTAQLVSSGLIDARQCELLLEVFNYNPVLFLSEKLTEQCHLQKDVSEGKTSSQNGGCHFINKS